jgi:glycosyltransferase involved in cell wall biosynthesis
MKLSVIIPCLNAADTVAIQLEALANQHWSEPWEVIVADNGSTDSSSLIVKSFEERLPNLRIVDSSDKRGAAHARNVGAVHATGESLAFCDADDEVGRGWVSAIGNALSRYDFVASRFEMKKLNSSGFFLNHEQEKGIMEYTYPPYLPHSGGCGIGIKRSLHEEIGGFDESMRALEDTDYCWRVQLRGVTLHFVPDAIVHIRFDDSVHKLFKQASLWGEYNVVIYKKYLAFGMPRLSRKEGLIKYNKFLKNLCAGIFKIRNKSDLRSYAWGSGWHWGRLKGSIKHRIFAL